MDVTIYTRRDGKVEEFTLEVWYLATVKEIKEEIGKRKGVPVASMQLFLGGTELMDAKNTEDYSILQGSRIRLVYYDE
jgi:ubiquitin C